MENKVITFLYSKYSPLSSSMMSQIQEYNLHNLPRINCICVDNKKVRRHILQSQKIKIKVVPTVLVMDAFGNIETYEGSVSNTLIHDIIQSSQPEQHDIDHTPPSNVSHNPEKSTNNIPTLPEIKTPEVSDKKNTSIEVTPIIDLDMDDLNKMSVSSTRPGLPIPTSSVPERESDKTSSVTKAIKNSTTGTDGKSNIINKARELEKERNKN